MDDLSDRIEDTAATVWDRAKQVLGGLIALGWTAAWSLVLLIGYLFTLPTVMAVSGGAIAFALLVVVWSRIGRRRRLEAGAARSLVLRSKYEGIKLDPNLRPILAAFDIVYGQIHEMIRGTEITDEELMTKSSADLEVVRDRLFDIAASKAKLLRDLRRLGRDKKIDVVRTSIEDARRGVTEKQREAEALTADTQKLHERLDAVRRIAGPMDSAASRPELVEILKELDHTATAYREIADAEDDEARKLRAIRAARIAKQRS